jgi:hypothetical protein
MTEFQTYQSKERLSNLNRAWRYLTPAQKLSVYFRVLWHSTPSLHQVINHIKYKYDHWLTYQLFPAHWVK